jgi:hypothetical protein
MSNDQAVVVRRPKLQVRGQQSNDFLKLTYDRKVSPRGYYQKSRNRWVAKIPNSFGLPAGDSCPGRTSFCDSCYGVGSEQSRGVRDNMEHNLRLLKAASSVDAMAEFLIEMVDRYVALADHYEVSVKERIFRIHWDGDFFSEDYARAWAIAIRSFPQIAFWVYTRSFVPEVNVVPILNNIENLALYLSTDSENAELAHEMAVAYPDVHLALCAEDYRSGRELAQGRRSLVCPENDGRKELMDDGRGACVDCDICTRGRCDVIFSTSHREDVTAQLLLPLGGSIGVKVGNCANPACGNAIMRRPGRGAPQKWCQPSCRWVVYRQNKKVRERAANEPQQPTR